MIGRHNYNTDNVIHVIIYRYSPKDIGIRMEQSALRLKKIADSSYQNSIDSILDKISTSKTNFSDLLANHSSRGYDRSIGKYQQYLNDIGTGVLVHYLD